ncbi:MAG: glycoside hydrolase family 88 protein [Chitinispirillaceae bacterium]|nr:glycoside hydrolase family 88 protein [Chitinispirillaceae bacterium]
MNLFKPGKNTVPRYTKIFFCTTLAVFALNADISDVAMEKGRMVANDYISRNRLPNSSSFNYFDACSYYGICLLSEAINDKVLFETIYDKYKSNKPSSIPTGDVDKNSSGLLPLYLFISTKDSSLLKLGKAAADNSLQHKGYPRTAIDDVYMTGSLMVQAYRATQGMKYLDFFAEYLLTYMDKLQQSDGLYWHKLDSRNYWGRGNGWGAAGATELLMELPHTHAKYADVLKGYQNHMAGLLEVQKNNGIWMQLLGSNDPRNWEETSGTAMFLFAIFTGLKNGWLDKKTYLEPAEKGWSALIGHLQGAKLADVAAGFWPSTGTASDYLNASKGSPGDSHGTAAFLWASAAVYQYFSDTLTTGVIKNCPDHVLTAKRSPITKTHYFDLNGRCISINNEPKIFQRQIPKIIITSDLNRFRPCITITK